MRGSPYRLPATKLPWKHGGGQANHLGTVTMQQDWVIRSRAPCVCACGEGSETRWQWVVARTQLKIESGPAERQPLEEWHAVCLPGARGASSARRVAGGTHRGEPAEGSLNYQNHHVNQTSHAFAQRGALHWRALGRPLYVRGRPKVICALACFLFPTPSVTTELWLLKGAFGCQPNVHSQTNL